MHVRDPLKNEKSNNIYADSVINPHAKTAIIFIAGIAASRRYWDKAYRRLASQYSLYFLDLLGFGLSAKPRTNYTLEKHIEAIHTFVREEVKEKQLIFVGHSMGCIIALGYMNQYPEQIKKAFLFGMPYFQSEHEAKEYLKSYFKPSFVVEDKLITRLVCTFCCYLMGPITRRVGHVLLPDLPKEVGSDGFLHTYNSYITTLYNVVYRQNIPALLPQTIRDKIILFHGNNDKIALVENIHVLSKKYNLKLVLFPDGAHKLPISEKEKIIELIQSTPL